MVGSSSSGDAGEPSRSRVSTLELFFDLVFVFTITQVTTVLIRSTTWAGLGRVVLLLGLIFWMYGGYAWLTNAVALDRVVLRMTLLCGMGGFLVVALAVPKAFGDGGAVFGVAYLVVVLIHFGMFVKSSRLSVVRAIRGLAPFNLATALLVVIGGFIGGAPQYVLWICAFVGEWVSPKLIDDAGFVIEPGHFVERHGLVVIVAIGESVVAVGIEAAGLPLNAALITIAMLGLALSAALWWTYFSGDDEAAERAMNATPPPRRPRLAINAFGYCHLLLLLGIVAVSTGLAEATEHPFRHLTYGAAIAAGGGAAVFLIGEARFRRTLALGGHVGREVCAVVALATIPLGRYVDAVAQIAVLVAAFVVMLIRMPTQSTQQRPPSSA